MKSKLFIFMLLALLTAATAVGQRRITPVEPSKDTKQQEAPDDMSRLAHRHTDDGRVVLVDTVTGTEYPDTLLPAAPKMIYPTLYKVTAGVNIWDAAMRCVGQSYGIGSVWGELNMHNRYFPYFEAGLGLCNTTPQNSNYTYHSPMAPYFKIGASYNIFYNSDPSYQLLVGLRYGFSPFSFSADNIVVDDPYWGETSDISIPSSHVTAGWFEVTAGVKVKIVSGLSMGWTVMYHQLLHESACPYGEPMYIPGYGKRGGSIAAQLSVMWSFTLNKQASPEVN